MTVSANPANPHVSPNPTAILIVNSRRRDNGKFKSSAKVPCQLSPYDCQKPKPIAKTDVIAAIPLPIRDVTNGISASDLPEKGRLAIRVALKINKRNTTMALSQIQAVSFNS